MNCSQIENIFAFQTISDQSGNTKIGETEKILKTE